MAETIEELRRLAAEAEQRGDWRASMAIKRRWFAALRAAADVDGRTEAERAAWSQRLERRERSTEGRS